MYTRSVGDGNAPFSLVCQIAIKTPEEELTPGLVFGANIPRVSKVWVDQLRVQGLADAKLILLSGTSPERQTSVNSTPINKYK